jgi:ribosome-associated protein
MKMMRRLAKMFGVAAMIPAMSRKPKKGYYVKGVFVAEGSELDLQLKQELLGNAEFSRTTLKKESEALQDLGEQLLTLRQGLMDKLDLPESLREALKEANRITNFEGKRRQMQYVGKLMRRLEPEVVQAAKDAIAVQFQGSAADTQRMHKMEHWRDTLIATDETLEKWMLAYPGTDSQALRSLIRQARKDAESAAKALPGQAPRQNRAYREIFQMVKAQFDAADTTEV